MNQIRHEVTRADVEQLWADALAHEDLAEVCLRAEQLISRANSENPVVNWGLTTVHAEVRDQRDRERLELAHQTWLDQLREFDRDPELWMTNYFTSMLNDFADRFGAARARAFGDKLIAWGQLTNEDVVKTLGPK